MHRHINPVMTLLLIGIIIGIIPPAQTMSAPLIQAAQPVIPTITAPNTPESQRKSLPLTFEPNVGQTDAIVRFHARGPSGSMFFTSNETVLALPTPVEATPPDQAGRNPSIGAGEEKERDQKREPIPPTVIRIRYQGANQSPTITSFDRLPGVANYLIGNEPARWRTNITTYAGIQYNDLYPGINLQYEGDQGNLKSTYIVAPGANPGLIRWRYNGVRGLSVDESGALRITVPVSPTVGGRATRPLEVTEKAPIAWQERGAERISVDVRYSVNVNQSVGFALGAYDAALPLIIDPTLTYSHYLGGSDSDEAYGIATDSNGNAYVAGHTASTDFPQAAGGQQPNCAGSSCSDVFITKLSPGGIVLYTTYLGGSAGDAAYDIAVDGSGNAFVAGETRSNNFPPGQYGYDTTCGTSGTCGTQDDAFAIMLNAAGDDLLYSTYLGGSGREQANGITVDATGAIYVVGDKNSSDFPTLPALPQVSTQEAFVTKLDPSVSGTNSLVYSTYLNATGATYAHDVDVDSTNAAYVTGYTHPADGTTFETTPGAFQEETVNAIPPNNSGPYADAYVVKLEWDGTALTPAYSTLLSGKYGDIANDIVVDDDGNAYVTGETGSDDFPTTALALDTTFSYTEAFVTKLNADGSEPVYSTFLGGNFLERGYGISVDSAGRAAITGITASIGDFFITTNALQTEIGSDSGYDTDAFVTVLKPDGRNADYSSYLGGEDGEYGWAIAFDPDGAIYVAGETYSNFFPTEPPQTPLDGYNGFVTKISGVIDAPTTVSIKVTDSAGNRVAALALNDDGWPALNADTNAIANPIKVSVTLTSTTTQAWVDMEFGSTTNETRFYPFATPNNCNPPVANIAPFSYNVYTPGCTLTMLTPGVPATIEWQLWVQPSKAGSLVINALMYDALPATPTPGTDTETVAIPRAEITPVVFLHGILGSMTPRNWLLTTDNAVHERLDPFLGSYWPLLDNLQKMGYELNKTLFPITYDWRNPNDVSADFIRSELSSAVIPRARAVDYVDGEYVGVDPVTKIVKTDMVVHSMGGLVARSYIQGDDYEDNVRKLVFIASPHKGFPFDYRIWEGMTWSDFLYNADGWAGGSVLLSYFMDNRLWPTLIVKKYKPTMAEADTLCGALGLGVPSVDMIKPGEAYVMSPDQPFVGYYCNREVINYWAHSINTTDSTLAANRGVRSLYEMLPSDGMQYLVNLDGDPAGYPTLWPWGNQTNTFLQNLNANIGNLTTRLGAENIYNIYGSGALTDSIYEVDPPPPASNRWRNGSVSDGFFGYGGNITEIGEGDDLIPEVSTQLLANSLISIPDSNEVELDAGPPVDSARHKEIMFHSDTQRNLVPRFLAGVTLPFETTYAPPLILPNNLSNLFSVNTLCPINILITDPQGRRLGYDPVTGQVLREIPNSVYTSPGAEPQIILIGDALPGTYQLKATGYDSGNYAIYVDNTTREGLQAVALFGGTTTANEVDSHSFTYHPNSLVAAYSFNEGTGSTVEDLSGYGNTGTISGAAWTTQGYFGNALVFDGTNDWVTVPMSDSLNLTSTLTLEAWVYPTSAANNWQSVIHKAIPNGLSYGLYALADTNLPGGFVTTSAETPVYGLAPLPLNRWSHLATTYDGTTLRLYVDGTLVNSTAISGAITVTNGELRIGGNAVWGDFFQGRIDEVRIYNRALSASELGHDRLRPIGEVPPPMTITQVAAYGFDEGTGTTTADTVGGNTGTISGAAWSSQGRFGNALDFDGTNDWVTVTDSASLDLTSGMTLMAWVNPDSTSGWQKALAKEAPGETAYALYASTDTDVPGGFVTTSSENGARGSSVLPTNSWSHIAVSYDGVRVTFYLNGVAVSSTPAQGTILNSSGVLRIGGDAIWGNFFDGQIDEVRIFAGALHDAEIAELMNTPVTSTP